MPRRLLALDVTARLLARACEGLGPQDIEKETGLVKSRDVAVNASLVLAKMEKEADD